MARQERLLPNAAIVARREYRDRVRSPLFLVSTVVLMALAVGVAAAPIAIRAFNQGTVVRVGVVAADRELASRTVAVLDSLLNQPPPGVEPSAYRHPYAIGVEPDEADAAADIEQGSLDAALVAGRTADGRGLTFTFRTNAPGDAQRNQLVGYAAVAVGILDWTAGLPPSSQLGAFRTPTFQIASTNVASEGGRPIDPIEVASRGFLGTVFVVLMFISVLIYGMWVATGVAAEKSSRVMELMISAASPRQLVLGKVAGIGGAGLSQYVAIAIPAVLVLAFQDRVAAAILGPVGAAATPITGLTPGLLVAYGVFFLLGFALYAFVYAAVGSFVNRPDDLQTLSLPLSLLAMAGYLSALPILLGGAGPLSRLASFLPPFSPFAMLARVMVGRVEPWEVALSIALLIAAIVVVAAAAIRIYAAGVLLYGQRPGLRTFLAAARRSG
ncbi:MAG: ABC transporter permease [Chloroflexota bacterium]